MSEATVAAIAREADAVSRPTVARAGRVVVAAGALGIVGQLLFFDVGLGINFPIAIALLLAGGWALRRPGARVDPLDAWLAPAALTFAAFAALRADATIVGLDLLTSLALAGAALASFSGRSVVRSALDRLLRLAMSALGWFATGAVPAASDARQEMPSWRAFGSRGAPAVPVLRGLALALPVVVIFAVLFSAADAVFARIIGDLFGFELDIGEGFWRLVLALALAWLTAGAIGLAASRPSAATAQEAGSRWRLGTTEVVTVLLAVDALFVLFVLLQGAYLFGGLDTMQAAGLTYAEYARRGFFELVAVAMLAGGLVVAGERLADRRTLPLLAAATGLTLMTGVVLVSAALRLRLYQEAYGWTELRFYVLATIAWLAIGLAVLLFALVRDRVRWIVHALIGAALAVGLVLNLIGPVRFITEQNVARVLNPELVPPSGSDGLDGIYAASLGDDAVPGLLRALPHLDGPARAHVVGELRIRLQQLRSEPGMSAWQAWNASREAARGALDEAAGSGDLR